MNNRTELYNIDFGPNGVAYAGRGLIGSVADHFWNKLAKLEADNVPLKKSDGTPGKVTLSSTGFASGSSANGIWGDSRFAWENYGDSWSMEKNSLAHLTLRHLPAGSAYHLVLYAFPGAKDRAVQADVNDGSPQQTSGTNNLSVSFTWKAAPDRASNYLDFTGTVPPDGTLTVHLRAVGGDNSADIQGVQVEAPVQAPITPGHKTVGSGSLISNLKAGRDQTAMFVGTSLTAGHSWPTMLQTALANKYEGRLHLVNCAISGTNSKSGVENINAWLAQFHPDAVFIEYGINDSYAPFNISPEQSQTNLDTMVQAVLKSNPDADIILLTMNNVGEKKIEHHPHIDEYYQGYRDYAAKHGMTLIDDHAIWKKLFETDLKTWNSYIHDGVHPTLEANRMVVMDNIVRTLEQTASHAKTRPVE